MNKLLGMLSPLLLLAQIPNALAAIDPYRLVKVTNDNNPQCVEYFTYKDGLYCSTSTNPDSVAVDPKIKDYETQKIVFDDRPWQAVWGKDGNDITTVEYIPAGDKIDQWHELVTSQFIPGLQNKTTPKDFAETMIKQMHDSGFNPTINMIKETADQVIFEFRISSPANLKQNEIQIITKGKKGFYILHYVIKESDMGQANREKWLQNLQKSKINPSS
ncbi:hypothetical protein BN59_02479 [Legionella massiliensis]|uniref:Secreted protein n=1 Tax=Legionella massiliensis TaxID=1034943 RepID=A0A078KZ04_9GAMM|nr:hypothetical protein [Legionella massiliensis]CDZ78171.1 hypothetical protein BN59_02479 [Legionella massiliensis]CEE13909.1 hypothetical protein BN1094_02479 [Legionella massiliensis]